VAGRAFVLRMNPLGIDRVPIGRQAGEISIGWGRVGEPLLNPRWSRWQFARLVHDAYYSGASNRFGSGNASGQLWRFIRIMTPGDLVLVPHRAELHVARVTGDATYDANPNAEHWAYRRSAAWLTGRSGLVRHRVSEQLQAAARTRLTCIETPGVLRELREIAADLTRSTATRS
jgi:predicted Mrr-cat superfamily restriction endonuclease